MEYWAKGLDVVALYCDGANKISDFKTAELQSVKSAIYNPQLICCHYSITPALIENESRPL
jgi:hypothetical protein